LALSTLAASVTFAKDLCIQVDSSIFAGSQVVVKKAKLGARNVAPAGGYLARFSQNTLTFFSFDPMAGQSLVSSTGNLALGMTLYSSGVLPGGGSANGTGSTIFNCLCNGGTDRKIGILDSCNLFFNTTSASGHIVDCTDVVAVP
jgi:hypothetical protein